MKNKFTLAAIVIALCLSLDVSVLRAADTPSVGTMRVPDKGVQPQAAVDERGTIHLIYLTGDPSNSDVYYIRSIDNGKSFSGPVRVNSQAGSAIAMGTVRGAHLAVGRSGRVHVAWMGSGNAEPKGPGKSAPMLYTRSTERGDAFEPQRNVIQAHPGLDGGGSVAADARGNVYIAWHAPNMKGEDEQSRRVWIARSADDGQIFSAEAPLTDRSGACGCCGMRILAASDGSLFTLYRTADRKTHRDMTLVQLNPDTHETESQTVGPMNSGVCVMSTAALAPGLHGGALAAWEREGRIEWAGVGAPMKTVAHTVPGASRSRKHPAITANHKGEICIAWAEDTGWNKGGSVAWQTFDAEGKPLSNGQGKAEGLPVWGAPAVFAAEDGNFKVCY